jgi:hypothetical protein
LNFKLLIKKKKKKTFLFGEKDSWPNFVRI